MTRMSIPGANMVDALDIITKATREIAALPDFKAKSETLDDLSKIACKLIAASEEVLELEDDGFLGGIENPFND